MWYYHLLNLQHWLYSYYSDILSFLHWANNNPLLTEREGRTGEYWPEVVAVRTERSEVRTKTTEGQYSPVRLELARLVSSLLYGTRTMLVLSLPAFENKKYTAYDRFHGNGPYGEIPTEKEPIRTLGFTLPYNNGTYFARPLYQSSSHFVRVCTEDWLQFGTSLHGSNNAALLQLNSWRWLTVHLTITQTLVAL